MPGHPAAQEPPGLDDRAAPGRPAPLHPRQPTARGAAAALSAWRDDQRGTFHTRSLRIDEFLDLLRERYGLHVDRLPGGDGFGPAIVTDHAALRDNRTAFIARLREIGFYSDLSDAYLTQTITPRYTIGAETSRAGA